MTKSVFVALLVAVLFLWGCFLPVRPVPACWPQEAGQDEDGG